MTKKGFTDADRHGWRKSSNRGVPYVHRGFDPVMTIRHDVSHDGLPALFLSDRGTIWEVCEPTPIQPTAITTLFICRVVEQSRQPSHIKGQAGIFGIDYINHYWRKLT